MPQSPPSPPPLRLKHSAEPRDRELGSIFWLVTSVFEYPASWLKFSNLRVPAVSSLGQGMFPLWTLDCTFLSPGALLPLPLGFLGTLSDGVSARDWFGDRHQTTTPSPSSCLPCVFPRGPPFSTVSTPQFTLKTFLRQACSRFLVSPG